MTNIEIIRELHCYRKMYNSLQGTVTDCIEECRDFAVREKLIKAQQKAEDIYTGEIYENKELTVDERIILELLSFIRDTEVMRVTEPNDKIINDCVDWLLTIQNKKKGLAEASKKGKEKLLRILQERMEDSE